VLLRFGRNGNPKRGRQETRRSKESPREMDRDAHHSL